MFMSAGGQLRLSSLPRLISIGLALMLSQFTSFESLAQQFAVQMEVNAAERDLAVAVQSEHQAALLREPGVIGMGVGMMEDGIRVGIHIFVGKGMPNAHLAAPIRNVPVRIIQSDGFVAHNGPCDTGSPCHAGTFAKPVPMGVSTGSLDGFLAGTLGFRVHRIADPAEVGYITNNHIAAAAENLCPTQMNPTSLAAFNQNQCQPGLFDIPTSICGSSRRIGALVQVIPLIMGGSFINTVDAAFVRSKRGCVSKVIRDIGSPSAYVQFPALGDVVKMSGRTSGLKTNKVMTINAVVDVGYSNGCGSARFMNQVMTEPVNSGAASLPGDSGAPVVKIVGASKIPVGLNFAGDGFFSVITPLPLVLSALGVQIDTKPDAPRAASCL